MPIHFGFSYIGFLFLLMLMIPNFIWKDHKPIGYDRYAKNENKCLLLCERIGQVLVTTFALLFCDSTHSGSSRFLFLLVALLFMILYEINWVRYFRSQKTMKDFYSSLFGIPVAGATLPMIAFLLLGIYEQNFLLIIATIILGIGHIGIHWNHKKEISS